ncbi:MAG TPA: transporter [Burkholderiales bacterium]|nr:transporter [Burkholderiales bacterium]
MAKFAWRAPPFAVFAIAVCAASIIHDRALASCGSAFCMVNTNWNLQGLAPEPGLRLDLRFEYIDQDQPVTASRRIGFGEIRRHHDELRTINRNWLATLDYTFNQDWGVAITLPLLHPTHEHIHNHGGAQLLERWDFTRVGDTRVLGRRQWMRENTEKQQLSFFGLSFGLKLPTGDFDVRNAAGALAERSLQPGTGTTDLLLGAFYSHVVPAFSSSWFVQTLWQTPLDYRADYRSGRRLSLDVGYRYEATDRIGLMLQLNTLYRSRDAGRESEPDDTGGRFVYLSPGVSYAVAKNAQIYAFVQKPLYQHVNGVQLTADWSALAGFSVRF